MLIIKIYSFYIIKITKMSEYNNDYEIIKEFNWKNLIKRIITDENWDEKVEYNFLNKEWDIAFIE